MDEAHATPAAHPHSPLPFQPLPTPQVEDAVEYMKQKGLSGAARAAADEVLARVREAKSAVLAAPAFVVHKVGVLYGGVGAAAPGDV